MRRSGLAAAGGGRGAAEWWREVEEDVKERVAGRGGVGSCDGREHSLAFTVRGGTEYMDGWPSRAAYEGLRAFVPVGWWLLGRGRRVRWEESWHT